MRWLSASRRPDAICAITSRRASIATKTGARVFDGVFTHVAGIGRVFFNTEFGQPARTRTWHEDHGFPEVEFPFHAASRPSRAVMRGDDSDPKLIETNTSTEYWQKGASLLHTDPDGTHDVALPANVRGYYLPGTQHGGKAGMPRDAGPCTNPRNWHDPMPAIRALLVALDEWVVNGREPPPSRLPRIADGTLVPRRGGGMAEACAAGAAARGERCGAARRLDQPAATGARLAGAGAAGGRGRQRDRRHPAARHRGAARHVHRLESVQGAATGRRAGRSRRHASCVRSHARRARAVERSAASLAERYPTQDAYASGVRAAVTALQRDRLLLEEDAATYLATAQN